MSPPTNAFTSSAVSSPISPQPGIGSANRLGNQENLATPYANSPASTTAAVKQTGQETLARRRVLLIQQDPPPFRLGPDDAASSSSASSSSSSSSSASAAAPARAGQRRASGQGLKGAATRAAPRSRPSTDNQVCNTSAVVPHVLQRLVFQCSADCLYPSSSPEEEADAPQLRLWHNTSTVSKAEPKA